MISRLTRVWISLIPVLAMGLTSAHAQGTDPKAELDVVRQAIQNGDYEGALGHDQAVLRAVLAQLRQRPQVSEVIPEPKVPVTTMDFLVMVDQTKQAVDEGNMLKARDYSVALATALYQEYTRRLPTNAQTLAQLEQKSVGASARERFFLLPTLGIAAYNSGDLVKAKQYASELLADAQLHAVDWPVGNAIHFGNIVAGRVALTLGDVDSAKADLLAAGKTSGSPVLNSFGPNMALARELLEKKEPATVIAYLSQCKSFWALENGRLSKWINMIGQGKTPDFGANLIYDGGAR